MQEYSFWRRTSIKTTTYPSPIEKPLQKKCMHYVSNRLRTENALIKLGRQRCRSWASKSSIPGRFCFEMIFNCFELSWIEDEVLKVVCAGKGHGQSEAEYCEMLLLMGEGMQMIRSILHNQKAETVIDSDSTSSTI